MSRLRRWAEDVRLVLALLLWSHAARSRYSVLQQRSDIAQAAERVRNRLATTEKPRL